MSLLRFSIFPHFGCHSSPFLDLSTSSFRLETRSSLLTKYCRICLFSVTVSSLYPPACVLPPPCLTRVQWDACMATSMATGMATGIVVDISLNSAIVSFICLIVSTFASVYDRIPVYKQSVLPNIQDKVVIWHYISVNLS